MKQFLKRRWALPALAAVVLIAVLLLAFAGQDAPIVQGNLLENGDFSQIGSDGMPYGWYKNAWINTVGYTDYTVSDGVATVINHDLNDARFAQDVPVQPDSLYCLSGFIRADASDGRGANLSVADVSAYSKCVYDSEGEWVNVRVYGLSLIHI